MKTVTKEELNTILEQHKLWLEDKSKGKRADLEGANLCGAILREANLRFANLSSVSLTGADLEYADLNGADLQCANLSGANLREANLWGANLRDASLRGAYLRDAELWGAMGNMREVKSIQIDTYPVTYTKDVIQIGCQQNSISKWANWKENKDWISNMDDGALEWAEKHLDLVLEVVKNSPAR